MGSDNALPKRMEGAHPHPWRSPKLNQARLKPARRLALAPHLPSRVTWPRRLPQVTDGMYGQLAYGMATAVYQVRSSRPLAGAAPAPHSPSYPWRRCR